MHVTQLRRAFVVILGLLLIIMQGAILYKYGAIHGELGEDIHKNTVLEEHINTYWEKILRFVEQNDDSVQLSRSNTQEEILYRSTIDNTSQAISKENCGQHYNPLRVINLSHPPLAISVHKEPDMATVYLEEHRQWDWPVSELIMHITEEIKKKVVFIDIGSFTGYYSAVAALSGAHKVFSFDHFRFNVKKTCETSILNKLHNVEVYNFILGNKNEIAHWCAPLDNLAFSIRYGCPDPKDKFYSNYLSQHIRIVEMSSWVNEFMSDYIESFDEFEIIVRIAVSEAFEQPILRDFTLLDEMNIQHILASIEWEGWQSPEEWITKMISMKWHFLSSDCGYLKSQSEIMYQNIVFITKSPVLCHSFGRHSNKFKP